MAYQPDRVLRSRPRAYLWALPGLLIPFGVFLLTGEAVVAGALFLLCGLFAAVYLARSLVEVAPDGMLRHRTLRQVQTVDLKRLEHVDARVRSTRAPTAAAANRPPKGVLRIELVDAAGGRARLEPIIGEAEPALAAVLHYLERRASPLDVGEHTTALLQAAATGTVPAHG